jgi:hypothetical protein
VAVEGQGGPAPAKEPAAAAAAGPAEVKRTSPGESQRVATRAVRGGIDDYNARQVAKRADLSVDELIAELEKNRAATIAAVERADETLLQTPIRSAGGITGPLAGVVRAVAIQHVMSHVADITEQPYDGKRW